MKLNRFLAGLCVALCLAGVASAATLLPPGRQTFQNANGAPLAGGSVTFYVPGTTTLKDTWSDAAQTVLNSNPVVLDAAGSATIYGTGSYRQVVRDRNGNLIWDRLTSDTSSTTSSWAGTSTGTANAQVVAAPNFTSQDGQSIAFVAGFTNTGPVTLNPSGAGPIAVVNDTQGGAAALTGGEIQAGNVVQVVYSASQGIFHTSIVLSGLPVGTMSAYVGETAPQGYLLARGQAVSRTQYARLFAVIGTAYGAGDGSTTFNLPAMGGRVPAGVDDPDASVIRYGAMSSRGGMVGEPFHHLTAAELPTITPGGSVGITYPAQVYGQPTQSTSVTGSVSGTSVWAASTTPSLTSPDPADVAANPNGHNFTLAMNSFGGGQSHNVVQPTIAVNYIVKY